TNDTKIGGLQSTFSRRNLFKGAAALAAAASVPEAFGQGRTGALSETFCVTCLYEPLIPLRPVSGTRKQAGRLLVRRRDIERFILRNQMQEEVCEIDENGVLLGTHEE